MLASPIRAPRLGLICDLAEENWPSMDLVGEMLVGYLCEEHSGSIAAQRLCPPMRRRFTRMGMANGNCFSADRVLNRFWDYPRWLRQKRNEFDLFHVVDHSYAQLVHQLPADHTVVTCHDLDTFRCFLDPRREPRSRLFQAMARNILKGLRKAARVVCVSRTVCDEIVDHGLIPPDKIVVISNGIHPSCSEKPDPCADTEAAKLLGWRRPDAVEILHVGSTIPRKRIDVLLKVFAAVRKAFPDACLLRVGGPFTPAQAELIRELDLDRSIIELPFLDRPVLAAMYRRAALLLQPSEREGFGLPVVEAMACGTPVVATDLPVLREVGGKAATYCPLADVEAWSSSIIELLRERETAPERWSSRRLEGLKQASKFSWAEYARKMVTLYQQVLST